MAALRNTGGVATITLSDGTTGYTLATNGILNGVTTVLTIAPGTVSGSVTALGVSGGQIHMTTGTVNGGITVDAPINNNGGAVTLVKNGVGTLILNSTTSDYSGGTVINSGILVFGSGTLGSGGITINGGSSGATTFGRLQWATGNTQDISASLTMVNGGNANLSTGGNTVAFANAVGSSSSSNLTKIGTGQLTFDANNTYTGETGVYAGTLLVNVAQTNTTSVRVGNGTANGGAAGAVLRLGLSNALTSGINVTVDGQGVNTLDLNGFNQTIGNLSLGSNSGGSSGTVTGTGSTLTITNGVTADGHNQGNNSIGTGVISVDFLDLNNTTQNFNTLMPTAARGALTINSVIQNGGLNKTGQLGQIFLTNANTFSGPTTISVGLLRLDNPLALQNSALDTTASIAGAANDGLRLNTGVTTLTLGGLNGNKNFAATGGVFSTTSNNYASVTALTLKPGSGSASYSGVIANGAASMTLTKSGIGTQILSNTNTYTGATDITDGTLLVNSPGSLDLNSAVTVNGGTLGGNGTINGSVTVTAAGNLAPGASAGTLSIGTDLDISAQAGGTGKLNFELDALANTNDLIAVTGALNIGVAQLGFGDFVFTNLGGLQVTGGTPYKLITSSGLTGSLDPANLSGPLGGGLTGTLQITGNDVELVVTSGGDATPPTLLGVNIVDDQSGGPIIVNTLVTYTVTFSEDIDATTVTSADFSNAGTSAFTIGTITETTPTSGIFTVQVTPTSAGTLQLRVPTTADITDAASNPLDNDPAIDDNTTITVQTPFQDWAGGANFGVDSNNDCIDNGMAWVLGAANPAANATALLPTFDNTTDATYFIYTYRRSDAANTAAGITIAVQYSSDLTNNGWTTAIAGPDIIITPTDNFYGASTDKVEVKINRTLAVGNKLFVRLITIQN
jgi:autotransporter-associated beta strand protein